MVLAVAQRCRDRDAAVRQEAFSLLSQFPTASLERQLALSDWQTLLDAGLAGPLPGGGGGAAGQAKHAAAIREAASALLLRYLGLDAEAADPGEVAAWEAAMAASEEEEEEEAWGAEEARPAGAAGASAAVELAWVAKLRALMALPPHAPGCPTAAHISAAWRAAVAAALGPEQLEVLGWGEEGSGEGGESGVEGGAAGEGWSEDDAMGAGEEGGAAAAGGCEAAAAQDSMAWPEEEDDGDVWQ